MSSRHWMSGPLKQGLRVIRLIIGFAVLIAGLLMLIFPGPAIIVIPIGLAILATEVKWAKRLLEYMKQRAEAVGAALKRKKKAREPESDQKPSLGGKG